MAQGFYGGFMGNAGALDDLVYRGQQGQMMPMPYYGGGMNIQQLANFTGPAQMSTDVLKANVPGAQRGDMTPMPYFGAGMGMQQIGGFAGPSQMSTDVIRANIPGAQMAGTPSFDINRRSGSLGGRSGEQLKRIYEGGTQGNEQLNEEMRRRGIMPGGPQLPMAMGMGVPAGFQNKTVS